MSKAEPLEKLLTPEEVADLLRKPVGWVYRWTAPSVPKHKRLPARYIGQSLRFEPGKLQKYIDGSTERRTKARKKPKRKTVA